MAERNNTKIVRPVVVDTDLGAVRNEIALKDSTVKVDPTVWMNNPTTVSNVQRIAQAFGVVGSGLQDMAKGEIDKARMDYAERKQAEAEAKQAAREAKIAAKEAEYKQRVEDQRNARQMWFDKYPEFNNRINTRSEELYNTEGMTQQSHADGMIAMLPELTKGLNQNELDVLQPKLMYKIIEKIDEGEIHFKR